MMKKDPKQQPWETVTYTKNSELPDIEQLERIEDFLPRPENLVFRPTDVLQRRGRPGLKPQS